jgi:ABC-type sugar transport system permease subunit
VFVTTNGAPANATTVPGLLVYRLAFNEGSIGTASALAVVLSIIVIVAVTIIRAVAKDRS